MICPTCHTEIGPLHRDGSEPDCPTCYRAAFDPATKHAAALAALAAAVAALETALDAATEHHHDPNPGETFTECHLCGEWDGHRDGCPAPMISAVLAAGLDPPPPTPARHGAPPRPHRRPPRAG